MSLVLPNTFACTSRTAVLEGATPIDFRPFAQHGLPEELTRQLVTQRFLVTASCARSSVSEGRYIDFTETLVKIPVHLGAQNYLFPVITYVDHEYSLIRGFLLGFHKVFAAHPEGARSHTVSLPGLDIDLREDEVLGGGEAEVPAEQAYPFLLWTDYSVGGARSHGFRTLVVEQYQRESSRFLRCARRDQTVANRKATVAGLYEIEDRFVVTGTDPLDV
ncbi:acetoacetate decarboxylase family protein (plasmid) [Streptomyces sp. BHT-5-2]|uniref:acetoacetate decarboxylase family protein n=1 Tax=unclassified Streptomyces TaxID=2593676 RepID=UPI001C8D74E3|nr:acetoacetate decarboxylase family protein [Streptomyces sp. BHT-5-2]QZL08786.1 acetoacetate decarboxylase family protein [Streptomyces sp. BHT-5-2]